MNTVISYTYYDEDYPLSLESVKNECVVEGAITPEMAQKIRSCLTQDGKFIPAQVGLPETRFQTWEECDGPWFSFESAKPTKRLATVREKIGDVVFRFLKSKNNWDPDFFRAAARKGYRAD